MSAEVRVSLIRLPADLSRLERPEDLNSRLTEGTVRFDWSAVLVAPLDALEALVEGLDLVNHSDALGLDTLPEDLVSDLESVLTGSTTPRRNVLRGRPASKPDVLPKLPVSGSVHLSPERRSVVNRRGGHATGTTAFVAQTGDEEESPVPMQKPDAETRRDTRLRFEQWAKNPKCEANTLSAVHGVSMAEIAASEGLTPSMGQSPFALARGQMFEKRLFKNGAERLMPELIRQGVLPASGAEFRDLRLKQHGGPCQNLDQAREATNKLFRDMARSKAAKNGLVVSGATISIPGGVMLPEAILVVDVLVARRNGPKPVVMVGEVKTYPDRGGYTDAKELAVARAQAGVYVHGLRLVLSDLGLASAVEVSTSGFLVLSRPGFNAPSVRAGEELEFQAERARRGFEKLRKAAEALPPRGKNMRAVVQKAATTYREGCVSFCDRAPVCLQKATEAGDPVILGEDVGRWVGLVGLDRAVELLDGLPALSAAEEDLLRRMKAAELPELLS